MTEMQLDPRATSWLDVGPSRAPGDSLAAIMTAVETTPQRRPRLRLRFGSHRVLLSTRGAVLAAAAVLIVAVAAVGGLVFRDPILDVVAPPPEPGDLLYAFPDTRSILELSGGPATADELVVVGSLPMDGAFVIAAACAGGGEVDVEVWNRSIEYGPDATEADRQPEHRLAVPCDGAVAHMNVTTVQMASANNEVVVAADAGTTWRVEVGQVRALGSAPTFPALSVSDGALVLMELDDTLTFSQPGPGIGIQVPEGATTVTALVQCTGDPVTVTTSAGGAPAVIPCDDPAITHRFEIQGAQYASLNAGTDGFAWVRMAAESAPGSPAARPQAPALPAGLAEVWFAEGDGENVAFGRLGDRSQTVLRVDGAQVGVAGGDHVAIARSDGDVSVLELWSMPDAEAVRSLATIVDGQVFGSWVDATHEQVFYGVVNGVTGEWRRVAFDGSGDTLVANTGLGGISFAQEVLAADDGLFLAQWCPLIGSCQRAIYDSVTGEVRQVSAGASPVCRLLGVAERQLVAVAPGCDATREEFRIEAAGVDGGAPVTIADGSTTEGHVIDGPDGARVVLSRDSGTRTTISVVGLDGTGAMELATFEHEEAMGPRPSPIRLPSNDWILLATAVGDTPGMASIGRPMAVLLNVVTGERIELPNLPYSR